MAEPNQPVPAQPFALATDAPLESTEPAEVIDSQAAGEAVEQPVEQQSASRTRDERGRFVSKQVDGPGQEAAPATETPATSQPPAEITALVDQATKSYGFSKEQAETFGESLPQVLAAMDRQAVELMRQRAAASQPESPVNLAPPVPERTPQPAQPAPVTQILKKLELALEKDNYDDGTYNAFTQLTEHLNQTTERSNQQQAMLEALAELVVNQHQNTTHAEQQAQSEREASFERDMDSFFDSLGEEYRDLYGNGSIRTFEPTSATAVNRNKLVSEIRYLKEADAERGRTGTTREYADRVLRAMHADKMHAQARRAVEADLEQRRKAAIARPAGQNGRPLSPREKAMATVAAKLAASGLNNF
jgi:hypothetical protein